MAPSLEPVEARISSFGSALVAFSGGTDSALVLALAKRALGDRAVAMPAVSASLPAHELAAAQAFAKGLGVRHLLVQTHELEDPGYAANPSNRCYFCKRELYGQCAKLATELGLATVLDGFNADDARDHRPGRKAAVEQGIVSPLAEAGMTKSQVREAALRLGLSVWDKPQSPCLSSRIPYGTSVTEELLAQVGSAENALRALGFREFRVRHHGEIARIEASATELSGLLDPDVRAQVDRAIKSCGYDFVAVDLEPFRSGRLNDKLVGLTAAGSSL